MNEAKSPLGWFRRQVENAVRKDQIPKQELFGMVMGVIVVLVMIAFFAIHQTRPTGFFTSEFGSAQAVFLYFVIAYGLVPQMMRLVTRRKNPSRLLDIGGTVLFLIASAYFLATFPFDFSHFKEPLPHALEFLIGWVSDDIAKALLALGVVVAAASVPYQLMIYRLAGQKMREVPQSTPETTEPPKT